jgi:hypothetical protein
MPPGTLSAVRPGHSLSRNDGIDAATTQEVPTHSQLFAMSLTPYQVRSAESSLHQLRESWPFLPVHAVWFECEGNASTAGPQYFCFRFFLSAT